MIGLMEKSNFPNLEELTLDYNEIFGIQFL